MNQQDSVNPEKIDLVVFSRKYKLQLYRAPTLTGKTLDVKNSAKYLGVVLDRKLTSDKHVLTRRDKFLSAFWTSRRAFGNTWNLSPKIIL